MAPWSKGRRALRSHIQDALRGHCLKDINPRRLKPVRVKGAKKWFGAPHPEEHATNRREPAMSRLLHRTNGFGVGGCWRFRSSVHLAPIVMKPPDGRPVRQRGKLVGKRGLAVLRPVG